MLPRYLDNKITKEILKKAKLGEKEKLTHLYSWWNTSEKDLVDFGTGVAMYFHSLKVLIVIFLIAGMVNIPNLIYFSSQEYSLGQYEIKKLLRGSAICNNQIWSPCPFCTEKQWDFYPKTYDRYAKSENGLSFIKVNECKINVQNGLVHYASVIFIIMSFLIMGRYHRRKEVALDESRQTATDYSIEVENPPIDSYEPEGELKIIM